MWFFGCLVLSSCFGFVGFPRVFVGFCLKIPPPSKGCKKRACSSTTRFCFETAVLSGKRRFLIWDRRVHPMLSAVTALARPCRQHHFCPCDVRPLPRFLPFSSLACSAGTCGQMAMDAHDFIRERGWHGFSITPSSHSARRSVCVATSATLRSRRPGARLCYIH